MPLWEGLTPLYDIGSYRRAGGASRRVGGEMPPVLYTVKMP